MQQRTAHHLKSQLDKTNIQAVIKSLRHANREILKHNKISEKIDDFITLQVRMKEAIREKPKIGESAPGYGSTRVQIPLVTSLNIKDALLIVKDSVKANFEQIILDLELANQLQVAGYEEVFGAKKPKHG